LPTQGKKILQNDTSKYNFLFGDLKDKLCPTFTFPLEQVREMLAYTIYPVQISMSRFKIN